MKREERSSSRRLLAFALPWLCFAGCAAAKESAPGSVPTGGSTGSAGSGGANGCRVSITPVSPATVDQIAAGPDGFARFRASTVGVVAANATWHWEAAFADGSPLNLVHPTPTATDVVEMPIVRAGGYVVTATYGTAPYGCEGSLHFVVKAPGAVADNVVLRIVPATATLPAQQSEAFTILGGTPIGDHDLHLADGTSLTLIPRRSATGVPIAAYVRITQVPSGTGIRLVHEAHVAGDGSPIPLRLPPGQYDVLIVPDDDQIAPLLLSARSDVDLLNLGNMPMDDGVPITGQVMDPSGAPVVNAPIVLRSGALSSTLARTDAQGQFTVRARAGTFGLALATTTGKSAALAVPTGTEINLPTGMGIAIAAAPVQLAIRLATTQTANLGFKISGAGANAKLLLESLQEIANAAQVNVSTTGAATGTVTGTVTISANARIHVERDVAVDGSSASGALPRAHYRATVFAAGAITPFASVSTRGDVDASAGDVATTMAMASPVMLTGTLSPRAESQDARVFALDAHAEVALAPAAVSPFVASVNGTGDFSLAVNPFRSYRVIIEPPAGGLFARQVLPSVPIAAAPMVLTSTLPRGLLHAGKVFDAHQAPVAGAAIAAYCLANRPNCADPESPLAETVSALDGSYRLTLPDPGVSPP